jgi:hypothetical protein
MYSKHILRMAMRARIRSFFGSFGSSPYARLAQKRNQLLLPSRMQVRGKTERADRRSW